MRTNEEKKKNIPEQKKGNQLDTTNTVSAETLDQARVIFDMAVDRLLDVNCWDEICGPLSAKFWLTDAHGNEIDRPAQQGDHFKINIPAPGSSSGEGFDWVRIEIIDDKRNPIAESESVTVRVRPTSSPLTSDDDTAHFFKEDATSSFVVERKGKVVSAEVHGRNEVPNATSEKPLDKVRNVVVGIGAIAGFSAPQWKSLVKGLLDTSKETKSSR
jgi:hypothetical protein